MEQQGEGRVKGVLEGERWDLCESWDSWDLWVSA
jgi:hypothetical protein